jgi:restriction system protein
LTTVAKKRGFIAELIHQQELAEKHRQQASAQLVRSQQRAAEQAERHRIRMQELNAMNDRYAAAQAAYEARVAEEQARDAKIAADNQYAADQLAMIDGILIKSVSEPQFSLGALKYTASHPDFDPGDLDRPTAKPTLAVAPPKPSYTPPPAPQGMSKLFQKRQHEAAVEAARAKWNDEVKTWEIYTQRTLPAKNRKLTAQFETAEHTRKEQLAEARAKYDQECADREAAAQTHAQQVDELLGRVRQHDPEAVLDFIEAILESSDYPETYPVNFEFEHDADSREVTISVQVPAPAEMWTLKSAKWVKSAGEIRETRSSQTEQRRRYNTTVAAVALRTMSELFRAEPSDIVKTISLTLFTKTDDPATGQQKSFRFVEVAADREQFPQYNLEKLEPAHALEHMHAAVSKNAFGLKAVSDVRGIRG